MALKGVIRKFILDSVERVSAQTQPTPSQSAHKRVDNHGARLGEHALYDFSMNVGEAEVAARVTVGEPRVVEAE
jgi:hypothetical protein